MSDVENNSVQKKEYLRRRYHRYYTWVGSFFTKPKNRAYTFLGLSLFCSAFFLFFAIRPTLNTIVGLRRQIADDKLVENNLQQKINALSQLQAEYEVIQTYLPVLNSALPTKADVADLVKSVEKLASNYQSSLSAIQIGETALSGNPDSLPKEQSLPINTNKAVLKETLAVAVPIPLVFTVEGNYNNIAALLAKINRLPRLFAIQNALLTKGFGKVLTTIRLNAYYLPILKQ